MTNQHYALKEVITKIIEEGQTCLYFQGRNFSDIDLNSKSEIEPLFSCLADELERYDYYLILASINFGIRSRLMEKNNKHYSEFANLLNQFSNLRNPTNSSPGLFVTECCSLLLSYIRFKIALILQLPELWIPQTDLSLTELEQKRIIEALLNMGKNFKLREN